jgi:hypothetical protein
MLGFFDSDQARKPVDLHAAQLTPKMARGNEPGSYEFSLG